MCVIAIRLKRVYLDDKNSCQPYSIAPCGHHAGQTYYGPCPNSEYPTPACKKQCQAGYSKSWTDDKHFGKTAYAVGKTVAAIQQACHNRCAYKLTLYRAS